MDRKGRKYLKRLELRELAEPRTPEKTRRAILKRKLDLRNEQSERLRGRKPQMLLGTGGLSNNHVRVEKATPLTPLDALAFEEENVICHENLLAPQSNFLTEQIRLNSVNKIYYAQYTKLIERKGRNIFNERRGEF